MGERTANAIVAAGPGRARLRLVENEINSQEFDSLDFVELVTSIEEAYGIQMLL